MTKYRTHTCGELDLSSVNEQVKLGGWVHSIRDHGSLLFIDLRDNYGITQCVIDVEKDKKLVESASKITLESVILIEGTVVARTKETINPNLSTGEIEVELDKLEIESKAEQIPFQVADETQNYPEDLRLKYRFLDLRTKKMHYNIQMRSKIIEFIRQEMIKQDFLEYQTPILTSSSPEGARDFLVPSRIHPGKFYALPQAPQQFKQLLMISGFDKYFQIAPCFRDEGLRADRLLYFYQLDMEMSFVEQEDVWAVIEPVIYNTFKNFRPDRKINEYPFPRIKYWDSMLKYGTDKPDLRNPIEICDVSNVFRDSNFAVFAKALSSSDKVVVRAIPAPQTIDKPRSFFDKMVAYAIEEGAKGLGYITWTKEGEAKGPVAKFLDENKLNELKKIAKLENGDTLFFSCGSKIEASKLAGKVRTKLGQELNLINKEEYKFCWITDFPMYELDDEGVLQFCHNPFNKPDGDMEHLTKENALELNARQFDLVGNGIELLSGAERNHDPRAMLKLMEIVGYSEEDCKRKFGALYNAFQYGAPPHAGMALGIDRVLMLFNDEPNIREVIAFPFNKSAYDPLMDAPNTSRTEEPFEPTLHPSAAEGDVDNRVAAPHVGDFPERFEEARPGDPDLLRFIGRSDELQPPLHLPEGDDLAPDALPQFGPRRFQARQLFAQTLLADVFVARLLQRPGHEFGVVAEQGPDVGFGLGPGSPCLDTTLDVELLDGCLQQHLEKGRGGQRPDADLEAVGDRSAVAAQVFHVPEVAELVLGPRSGAARLHGLHGKTAQYQPFGQLPDLRNIPGMNPGGIGQRLRKVVLDERKGKPVDRIRPHGVGQHPVGSGGDLGDQVGISRRGELRGGCGRNRRVEQHAERRRAVERLFVSVPGDRGAVGGVAVHRGGGPDDQVAAAVVVGRELGQVVDDTRPDGYRDGVGPGEYSVELLDETPFGIERRVVEDMGLVLLDAGLVEALVDLFSGYAPCVAVSHDNGPFPGEELREEFRHTGKRPDSEYHGPRIGRAHQGVFNLIHAS